MREAIKRWSIVLGKGEMELIFLGYSWGGGRLGSGEEVMDYKI